MTTEPLALFINPTAGRGRAGKRLTGIQNLFQEAGISVEIHRSRSRGDLEKQVREYIGNGADRLVVAGGDGSIHEAVNGMLSAENSAETSAKRPAALGVIPTGTGNDFAKASDIPHDWETATRLLATRIADVAAPRKIDLGRMNGRYFANGAGIGLDAKVTRIAQAYRWPIGDVVYLIAIFRAMIDGIATPEVTINGERQHWQGPLTLASISNGPWIGGMFHIAPMAQNDDGNLELLIAAPVTRRRIMRLVPKLMRGEHIEETEISHERVRRLQIESTAPLPSHLDGEVQELQSAFEIEILPGALNLL